MIKDKDKKKIIVLNIIIPIVAGAIIYYLFSPQVIFVKKIDGILGVDFHFTSIIKDCILFQFVRFYFLDMLWAYALVFALFFILDNNTAELKKIVLIAFLFSTTMEILQMTPYATGTFDVFDIIAEFLAEVIAVFIIKKYILRRYIK